MENNATPIQSDNKSAGISLSDLWKVFCKCWWILLIVAVLCSGSYYAVKELTFVPKYESTATMYIVRSSSSDASTPGLEGKVDDSAFLLAKETVPDCEMLIKTNIIAKLVREDLNSRGIELPEDFNILSSLTITNPSTRILYLTIKASSPEIACEIANSVAHTSDEYLKENAFGFKQLNIFEEATPDPVPCNKTRLSVTAIIGIVGAVIAYAVFLLISVLDDSIHSDSDVEQYLGLNVLGVIPHDDDRDSSSHAYGYGHKKSKGKSSAKAKNKN